MTNISSPQNLQAAASEMFRVLSSWYCPPPTYGYNYQFLPGVPPFTLQAVDAMVHDYQVKLALAMKFVPLMKPKFTLVGDPELVGFVEETIRKLWTAHIVDLLQALPYTRFGAEVVYKTDPKSQQVKFDKLMPFHPRDFRILTRDREIVGLKLVSSWNSSTSVYNNYGINTQTFNQVHILAPKSLVYVHGQRFGSFEGTSVLEGSFEPWIEKVREGGGISSRSLYFYKCVFDSGIIFHPPGAYQDPETGQLISHASIAQKIVENIRNGSTMAIETTYDSNGNPAWQYQKGEVQGGGDVLLQYIDHLDHKIVLGAEIPDDVITQNSGTGSYAGRTIPFIAFLESGTPTVRSIVKSVKEQLLHPLTVMNFGEDRADDWDIVNAEVNVDQFLGSEDQNGIPNDGDNDGVPNEDQLKRSHSQPAAHQPQQFSHPFIEKLAAGSNVDISHLNRSMVKRLGGALSSPADITTIYEGRNRTKKMISLPHQFSHDVSDEKRDESGKWTKSGNSTGNKASDPESEKTAKEKEIHVKIGRRFGIHPESVASILHTPAEELRRRDNYHAPSNTHEPTLDYEKHPINTAKIGLYGDPLNSYVEVLREFNPDHLLMSEAEDGIKQRSPSYRKYVEWAERGIEPPPIFVAESERGDGKLISTNRRRVLAAQEARVPSIKGWYSPVNWETNLPLKYGDVIAAYNQHVGQEQMGQLSDFKEDEHPRNKSGEFATKNSSGKANDSGEVTKSGSSSVNRPYHRPDIHDSEDVDIYAPSSGELLWSGLHSEAKSLIELELADSKGEPLDDIAIKRQSEEVLKPKAKQEKPKDEVPVSLPSPSNYSKFSTGNPIKAVVYRGTASGGTGSGMAALGHGTYYALEPAVAERFSKRGTVKSGLIELRNPIVIHNDEEMKAIKQHIEEATGHDLGKKGNLYEGFLIGRQPGIFTKALVDMGFDGLVTTYKEAPGGQQLLVFPGTDIQMGQLSFNFKEEEHPRNNSGEFAKKGDSGIADEPFTLKREKSTKFVPKKQSGVQTDLFGKSKTTQSPADAHVKSQVESLPGQKTIADVKPKGKETHEIPLAKFMGPMGVDAKSEFGNFNQSLKEDMTPVKSSLRPVGNGYSVGIATDDPAKIKWSERMNAPVRDQKPDAAVLMKDDQIVGIFQGDAIAIDPEHRGKGLSKHLYAERVKLGSLSRGQGGGVYSKAGYAARKSFHKHAVIDAIDRGLHVPENVLADYPELASKSRTAETDKSTPTVKELHSAIQQVKKLKTGKWTSGTSPIVYPTMREAVQHALNNVRAVDARERGETGNYAHWDGDFRKVATEHELRKLFPAEEIEHVLRGPTEALSKTIAKVNKKHEPEGGWTDADAVPLDMQRHSTRMSQSDSDASGRWITIGGHKEGHGYTRLFIGKHGQITKGPKTLIGSNIRFLGKRGGNAAKARRSHIKAQSGSITPEQAKKFGSKSHIAAHANAKQYAKEYGVSTHDVLQNMPEAHKYLLEQHTMREDAKRHAVKTTGITPSKIGKIENAYRDHSTVKDFDVNARSVAIENPELGFDPDDTDTPQKVWDLIKEGLVRKPHAHHPEVAKQAAEWVSMAKKGKHAESKHDEEEDTSFDFGFGRNQDDFWSTLGQDDSFQFSNSEHEFSSTQFDLGRGIYSRTQGSPVPKLQELARSIPDGDLAEDGREDDFHVTVKYGIHSNSSRSVRDAVKNFGPVVVKLGKTSIFPASDGRDYDVVKVDIESEDLHRLNKLIDGCTDCTTAHPVYMPHVTLAYVKPGTGEKYAGNAAVEGMQLTFADLVFSDKSRDKINIDLRQQLNSDQFSHFEESEHPRGQPDNAGQFAKTSGGGSSGRSRQELIAAVNKASANAARQMGVDELDMYDNIMESGIDPSDYESLIDYLEDLAESHEFKPKQWEPENPYAMDKFEAFEHETESQTDARRERLKTMNYVRDKFRDDLVKSDVPNSVKTQYLKTTQDVLEWMPHQALQQMAKNVSRVVFYNSTKELTKALHPDFEGLVGGCWELNGSSKVRGRLHLDGKPRIVSSKELYAHEFTHAIDFVADEYAIDRGPISATPEWQDAFKSEIVGGQLSEYAATVDYEGFAEFGRLVYGTGVSPRQIEKQFPKCYAVFKKHGLVR